MSDDEQLVRLSEEISRLAADLARLSEPPVEVESRDPAEPNVEAVQTTIKVRRRRSKYLPSDLFADPAWDMLLELLHAELTKRRICITSLCGASGVPQTTALRWVHQMIEQGVLVRRKDRSDRRRSYVELAPPISLALRRYFVEVIEPESVAA